MHVLRAELEQSKLKYAALKKNFDGATQGLAGKSVSLEQFHEINANLMGQLKEMTEAKLQKELDLGQANEKCRELEQTVEKQKNELIMMQREHELTQKEMSTRY